MKQIILILGTSRSGSTMLDLILGNDEKAMSCGEVYAYFRPWRKSHRNPACGCSLKRNCHTFELMKNLNEEDFHVQCLKKFNKEFIVDSSKELTWVIDINANNKNKIPVKNVLIYKDPIDLAYSHFKRGGEIFDWRKEFVIYHRNLLTANIPFVSISYNNFIESIDNDLKILSNVLNIAWFKDKKKFWQSEYHHFFGSAGTRGQGGIGSELKIPRYSDSFLEHHSFLTEEIKHDNEVQQMLKKLRQSDFKNRNANKFFTSSNPKKPLFYYISVAKRYIKYLFPKESPRKYIECNADPKKRVDSI